MNCNHRRAARDADDSAAAGRRRGERPGAEVTGHMRSRVRCGSAQPRRRRADGTGQRARKRQRGRRPGPTWQLETRAQSGVAPIANRRMESERAFVVLRRSSRAFTPGRSRDEDE